MAGRALSSTPPVHHAFSNIHIIIIIRIIISSSFVSILIHIPYRCPLFVHDPTHSATYLQHQLALQH